MKCFLALFLCCSSLALATTQNVPRGILVSSRAATCVATEPNGLKCDTCTEAIMCAEGVNKGPVSCKSPNMYCDPTNNACTDVLPAGCTTTTSTFKCPSEGYFPDPSDCTKYHYCAAVAGAATTYNCPVNQVYDALAQNCIKKHYDSQCVTMKCVEEGMIVHAANPNYYAHCDKNLVLTLAKCPLNMQYSDGCRYVCKQKGYFPGKTEDEYYQCTKNSLHKLTPTTTKCPAGQVFSATTNNCVVKV